MAAPYDPVRWAFEKSIRGFKAGLKNPCLYDEILKTKSIDEVYAFTDELQKEQRRTGRLRHLSKIEPYLRRLNEYEGAISTFVQVKPDILALLWGPVKLLIQWTDVLKKSFDAIINTIGEIGGLLPEFSEMATLFDNNSQLNDVLALFFQDILDFYAIALNFFGLSYWRLTFEAIWPRERDRIGVVISCIEQHKSLMRNEVRLEHIRAEYEFRQRALQDWERNETARRRQEYNEVQQKVSPRTYETELNRIRDRTCKDTGKWLLRDPSFLNWVERREQQGQPIWLKGIPGAGKTHLSGIVVDTCLKLKKGPTLFVFLSYKHSADTSPLSIIQSLIFQLASDNPHLEGVVSASPVSELKREMDVAVTLLTTLIRCIGPVYIIIDGVDEIEERSRTQILQHLLEISATCDKVRALISSRMEDDILSVLSEKTCELRVDQRNAGAIQSFVNQRIEQCFASREFEPEAQLEIKSMLAPLSSKAKGMFLYAEVVFRNIEHLDTTDEIRRELIVLPESLEDAYGRILSRIDHHPAALREKARKLLGWVGVSPSPMMVRELEQALISGTSENLTGTMVIAEAQPVRVCGPILDVVDDYVQFIHFTAKEYIFSPNVPRHLRESDAALNLATCCLRYICQRHHDIELSDDEICDYILAGGYRLHEYSSRYWAYLVNLYEKLAQPEDTSQNLVNLLQELIKRRLNPDFDEENLEVPTTAMSSLAPFTRYPQEIRTVLRNAILFEKQCSRGECDRNDEKSWIDLDPLSVSTTSVLFYENLNDLLHKNRPSDKALIRKHHGTYLFKCSFMHCFFARHGFESVQDRNSHQKLHSRPWKCPRAGCPFVQGFLSQRMQDQHWELCHRKEPSTVDVQNIDRDDMQPLLFDLIEANNVDSVLEVLRQMHKNTLEVSAQVLSEALCLAIKLGFSAIVDIFLKFADPSFVYPLFGDEAAPLVAAIGADNSEIVEHLIGSWYSRRSHILGFKSDLRKLMKAISKSKSELIWSLLEEFIPKNFAVHKIRHTRGIIIKIPAATVLITAQALTSAERNLELQSLILRIWQKINLPRELGKKYLGSALVNVARFCPSVKLAKYLVGAGAAVDHRRGTTCMTPLHHAATHTYEEAAHLMRFLLEAGANPNLWRKSKSGREQKIRDEIGAKNIARWLGVDWDQLVEETRTGKQDSK